MKEGNSRLEEARSLYQASNQREAQLSREKEELLESIEKSAEVRAKNMVKHIMNDFENKQRRVNNFAVAAISILMIYSMCVTGA